MDVRELFHTVYEEIGRLESLKRQREMIVNDCAGIKAIQYEAEKVRGGHQSDLVEIVENIEFKSYGLDIAIAEKLNEIMEHREAAYRLLGRIPDSPAKTAIEEHYLYRVPWEDIAKDLHFSTDYVRQLARGCMEELQELSDKANISAFLQ